MTAHGDVFTYYFRCFHADCDGVIAFHILLPPGLFLADTDNMENPTQHNLRGLTPGPRLPGCQHDQGPPPDLVPHAAVDNQDRGAIEHENLPYAIDRQIHTAEHQTTHQPADRALVALTAPQLGDYYAAHQDQLGGYYPDHQEHLGIYHHIPRAQLGVHYAAGEVPLGQNQTVPQRRIDTNFAIPLLYYDGY